MSLRNMYVVMVREKGLFLVEPAPGRDKNTTIEAAIGLKSGYSAGLIEVDVPDGAEEAWAAWVEGKTPNDEPYFMYRSFEASLTEEEVLARLEAAGEEVLKLNVTPVFWADSTQPD